MKKNDIVEFTIDKINFPNKALGIVEGTKVEVKNGIAGQRVSARILKKRHGKAEGKILEVLEKSPLECQSPCPHFGLCGGCTYQNLPYEEQLSLKANQVKELLDEAGIHDYEFLGIERSPSDKEYRNKMEFSFGDDGKDGQLSLGMRKRDSYYEVVNVVNCQIIDEDYRKILLTVLEYFREKQAKFYHKNKHEGMLRHLVVRKAKRTGQILINLITSSQISVDLSDFAEMLLNIRLDGEIKGILHTINDSVADVVKADELRILYGQDYFMEELLGLKFKISAFSFFQTNSLGAERLYSIVREFASETKAKVLFDLYCGTGTIAQLMSSTCDKVIGIELVEEAIASAKVNAQLNGITNCEFIAGDVLKMVDELTDKPDVIILDPPRDGIHPKAIDKIIDFQAERIVYVSCKPTSLARDLQVLEASGYKVKKVKCMDMFGGTVHVECVVLMSKVQK